jgi:hypothetical protein
MRGCHSTGSGRITAPRLELAAINRRAALHNPRWGFSQIAVLNGADWVNCRRDDMLVSHELRCGGMRFEAEEVGFAVDSPLEGRVHCELVSEIRCRFR